MADDIIFSKNGRWLAAAHGTVVTLWEVATGRVWRDLRGHSTDLGVTSIDFSPDGRWLASAGGDQNIKIWEVGTGREVRTISGHTGAVHAVVFSPDGTRLASATGSVLELWDVSSGKELREFPGHTKDVKSVAFSPDGKRLATAGDGTVRIWDAGTGRSIRTLVAPNSLCRSAQFSPDGRLLAWACRKVTLSETSTWSEVRTFNDVSDLAKVRFGPARVRFSPDGAWLAASGYPPTTKVWEVSTGKLVFQIPGGLSLAFSPDSRALAVYSRHRASGARSSELAWRTDDLKFWEVPSGRFMQALPSATDVPSAIALDASAKWLASSADREVRLWEIGAGRVVRTLGGTDSIVAIALSSDGRWVASGGGNGIVRIRETATGRDQQTFRQNGDVVAIAFSPDGRKLASAANIVSSRDLSHNPADYSLKLYDTATGRELQTLGGHRDRITGLAFSPDGRWLASASCSALDRSYDDSVRLWDVATGRQLLRFSGQQRCMSDVAFSPDGRLVAASGGGRSDVERVVRVWEAATGRGIHILAGHTGSVRSVAFSPNGRQLASGGGDGQIIVWDVNSGRPVRTLLGHGDYVNALQFSPTGRLLISGSRDGSVRLWDPQVPTAELALLATRKGSGDWVAATPNGLFDGSSQGMQELIAWRIGTHLYPIDRFFADFYTPGLLARIFQGGRLDPPRALAGLKLPPEVHVIDPATGSVSKEPRIAVRVQAKDEGGGLTEVRLYQNGKLIEAHSAAGDRNPTFTFQLNLIRGDNVLKATALSADSVESNDDSVRVTWTPPTVTGKPVMHVLVVGINLYEDARFQLHYAKQDAEAIANFFERRGSHLFSSVKVVRLLDHEASKAKILQALKRVATEAGPEDLVFIYMAGHGVSLGQQYYFLAQEMRLEESEEAAIRKYGLPATELGDALRTMKALKQILIFDSCQSGRALPQLAKGTMFRGLQAVQEMDRAVSMLARANGIYLLAAATEQQYALEVPELGHGVLTYALLSGLGETGTPQAPATNGMVTILALLQYVNQQVPELTEKYHGGSKQYPVSHNTGMDFPLWAR